jgi:hypothetical protein
MPSTISGTVLKTATSSRKATWRTIVVPMVPRSTPPWGVSVNVRAPSSTT